jgi:hypothetical protein
MVFADNRKRKIYNSRNCREENITPCVIGMISPVMHGTPTGYKKTVKFVASDIDNFWRAYDLARDETNKATWVAIAPREL